MKHFVISKSEHQCPICKNQMTMLHYGSPEDLKYGPPETSFSFCYKCTENPKDLIRRVKGILLLGDKQT